MEPDNNSPRPESGREQFELPPEEPINDLPPDKPSKRKPIGCLSSLSYLLLIIGISVLLAAFGILAANDMFALVKPDTEATITIEDGATLREIANELHDAGLIRYPSLFWAFAKMTDMDNQIEPGEHALSASMDYRTILSKIKHHVSGREIVTVTIPEGMEQDDIFALLESKGVCDADRLAAFAKYYDFSYSFLEGVAYSDKRLEGYLFPDTYDFYVGDDAARVLRKFLANYKSKWSVDMLSRAENMNMSTRDILIIASMIEREAKYDEERPVIASVIFNRLQSDKFPYLQIDATVQYILPERKENLTESDLAIESPYNTYTTPGLPVGPICNPGLAAIRAALYPEESGYYYYVARKNGYHYFASTLDEHNANIAKAQSETIVDEEAAGAAGIEG